MPRPFRRLRLALSLSSLGQWLCVPALTAMAAVLARDEDVTPELSGVVLDEPGVQAAGLVLVALLLPPVLLAPVGAALAARLDRRAVLLAADALRAALVVSVPLVSMTVWTVAVAFLVGCLPLLWTPAARSALLAALPGGPDGPDGSGAPTQPNAARGNGAAVPVVDGPKAVGRVLFVPAAFAAVLFALIAVIAGAGFGADDQVDAALYVTAVVFLLSAAATAAQGELRGSEVAAVPAPLTLFFRGPGTGAGRGLGLAAGGAALTVAAVVAVARVHTGTLGGGNAGYGAVLACLAVGLGFGLFLGPRVLGPFSRRRLLGLAVIAAGLALIVASLVQNLPVAAFTTAFVGLAAGAAWSAASASVRGGGEAAGSGRPLAYLRSVALIIALAAVAAAPPFAALLGTRRLAGSYHFAGTGAALLIAGLLALLAGLVAFRRLDDRRGIPLGLDLAAALRGEVYTPPRPAAVPEQPVRRNRGVFIAFEGGEGAGKTTQARLAAIWLRDHGYDVVTTHEPGATKIGMRLRAMLLDRDTTGLSDRAETLLYAADRADHVANVVGPAMERGAIVVSDRYVDSSLAYQGYGRGQRVGDIARLNAWATGGLVPDLTVLLEVPPETGLRRLSAPADRIESEPAEFHERVRAGFRALAEADPGRYLILDASRPQGELSREIQYRIREILPDPVPVGTEDATSTFPAIKDF